MDFFSPFHQAFIIFFITSRILFFTFNRSIKKRLPNENARKRNWFSAHALKCDQYFPFRNHFPDWVSLWNIWFYSHARSKRIFTNRNGRGERGNGWVEREDRHSISDNLRIRKDPKPARSLLDENLGHSKVKG